MSNIRKKILKRVRRKSVPLIKAVLRSGADIIGNRLLDAVSDVNQPSDILLERIFAALKGGALATGQEMMRKQSVR